MYYKIICEGKHYLIHRILFLPLIKEIKLGQWYSLNKKKVLYTNVPVNKIMFDKYVNDLQINP